MRPDARALVFAGAALLLSCSEDVVGGAPSRGDIVDPREMNLFQARLSGRDDPPYNTTHPECSDGRCIDVLFAGTDRRTGAALSVCPASLDTTDFILAAVESDGTVRQQWCGADAFDKVLYANARGRTFADPPGVLRAVGDRCGADRLATPADTVTVHLRPEVFDTIVAAGLPVNLVLSLNSGEQPSGGCAVGRAQLIVERLTLRPDQNCPPPRNKCFIVESHYNLRPADPGAAVFFTLDDAQLGLPPQLVESTLRSVNAGGLLRPGVCPAGICGTAAHATNYFPPHGQMRGAFDPYELAQPVRFGVLVDTADRRYYSVTDLEESGAPIRILGETTGAPFDPPVDLTFVIQHRDDPAVFPCSRSPPTRP
jgi:hypothetical protein